MGNLSNHGFINAYCPLINNGQITIGGLYHAIIIRGTCPPLSSNLAWGRLPQISLFLVKQELNHQIHVRHSDS